MESRLPIFKAKNVYVPRDEKFSHLKISDFLGDTFKSLIQAIVGVLDAYFDTTPKMFKDLEEVLELYEGAIKLPRAASLRKNIPTKFLKALFRSDGGYFLNYPIPDIIKGKHAYKLLYLMCPIRYMKMFSVLHFVVQLISMHGRLMKNLQDRC